MDSFLRAAQPRCFGAFVVTGECLSDDNFAMPCAHNRSSLLPDDIRVLVSRQDTSANAHYSIDARACMQYGLENVETCGGNR